MCQEFCWAAEPDMRNPRGLPQPGQPAYKQLHKLLYYNILQITHNKTSDTTRLAKSARGGRISEIAIQPSVRATAFPGHLGSAPALTNGAAGGPAGEPPAPAEPPAHRSPRPPSA